MRQNFHGGKLHSWILLNLESVPVNHGLVDRQYKSRKMIKQKLYCKFISISYSKHESFPHISFAVCSIPEYGCMITIYTNTYIIICTTPAAIKMIKINLVY